MTSRPIKTGHSFKIKFSLYTDSTKATPFIPTGTSTLAFCVDQRRNSPKITLSIGSGLVQNSNVFIATVTTTQNILSEGTVFVDLHNDVNSDSSKPLASFQLPVISSRPKQ